MLKGRKNNDRVAWNSLSRDILSCMSKTYIHSMRWDRRLFATRVGRPTQVSRLKSERMTPFTIESSNLSQLKVDSNRLTWLPTQKIPVDWLIFDNPICDGRDKVPLRVGWLPPHLALHVHLLLLAILIARRRNSSNSARISMSISFQIPFGSAFRVVLFVHTPQTN